MGQITKSSSIIPVNRKIEIRGAHVEKPDVRYVEFQVLTILAGFYRNQLVLTGESKASPVMESPTWRRWLKV